MIGPMDCSFCEETNSTSTMVWCDLWQDFVCEDCWRPGYFDYWGA